MENAEITGSLETLGQTDGEKEVISDYVEKKKVYQMEHASSDMMLFYLLWRKIEFDQGIIRIKLNTN